jgi:hypothetical protein
MEVEMAGGEDARTESSVAAEGRLALGHTREPGKNGGKRRLAAVAAGLILAAMAALLARGCGPEPKNMLSAKAKKAAAREFKRTGVTLTIQEPIGIERRAEPVTSGVPLPEGCVKRASDLRLLDAAKKPVPCQFTTQCLWPDGSVKWVLLDFRADVRASNRVEYVVSKRGRRMETECPVKAEVSGGVVRLETRNWKLGITTNVAGLISSLMVDGKEIVSPTNPAQAVLVDGSNRVFRASRPDAVVLEVHGPLRSTVRVSGHFVAEDGATIFGGKVGYDLRVTAYAGKSCLKLDFTLRNDGWYGYRNEGRNHPRQWLYIHSLRLDMPVTGTDGPDTAVLGGRDFVLAAGERVDLTQWYKYPLQTSRGLMDIVFTNRPADVVAAGLDQRIPGAFHYTWTVSNRLDGTEGKVPGWAVWNGGTGAPLVGLAVRRFWQNFPIGFSARGDGVLSFAMFPERGCWPRTREAYDAATCQFEGGRRKTATLLLTLSHEGPARDQALALLDAPLFARAPAAWYRDTGAVLPLAEAELTSADKEQAEAIARYDRLQRAKVRVECGDPAGEHPKLKRDRWGKVSIPGLWERFPDTFCGWMNYGDLVWSFGYCSLYYEWPYSMLQHYLRLGDREFLDVAEDMIRHRYDIDQYHVENTEPHLGGFQRYEKGEHGHLARQVGNPLWEKNTHASHTWNRCLLLHWALTGDPRSLDVAQQNGRAFHRFLYGQHKLGEKPKLPWGEFRVPVWAMENWLALYEYTGRKEWLDRANEVFDKTLLAMERDNGERGHILKDGKQGAQFTGYMVEPVARLHHVTGRPDVIEFLKRALDWQRTAGTVRGEEKDGVYYPLMWREDWDYEPEPDEPITIGVAHHYNYPMLDGYAYLYRVLRRPEDLEFSRRLFKEAMFYIMTDRVQDRSYRSPLGYHHLTDIFGFTPKLRAWDGRYGQIYLYVEEHEAQCR